MRKKKYENFIAKLMMTKDIIDAAELEKQYPYLQLVITQ